MANNILKNSLLFHYVRCKIIRLIKQRRQIKMKYIKHLFLYFLIASLTVTMCGCRYVDGTWESTDKLRVITTLFPYYDFVREIAGDTIELKLLLPAGQDTHSFEPTPADMINIQKSDVFLYNGGESEVWVEEVLASLDQNDLTTGCVLDAVSLLEEEHDHDDEEEDISYDEHIWTAPANAILIVDYITEILSQAAPQYADLYRSNADAYIDKLSDLDKKFQDLAAQATNKTIVVGDKYPFLYFSHAYGFSYEAAFSGCSHDTEASAKTMARLISYVKEHDIPVVYYLELSSHKTADAIAEASGAKTLLLHSCHSVTKEEWESGATYLSLMEQNLLNLKEGLCQ
jgi:zinc transport system substrate-binding protein